MSSRPTASKPTNKAALKAKVTSQAKPAKTPVGAASQDKLAVKRKAAGRKPVSKVAPQPAKAGKPEVLKKPKLVRDSFTLPQADHDLIKQCKKAALGTGRETKKSEVVRAAIQSFAALPITRQIAAYGKLQAIALGRPKGN
jgi:hypothetical protein